MQIEFCNRWYLGYDVFGSVGMRLYVKELESYLMLLLSFGSNKLRSLGRQWWIRYWREGNNDIAGGYG